MSLIFRVASQSIILFLGNAQSVASRNVWNGVSSELNAFQRNLLKTPESSDSISTQVAKQAELAFRSYRGETSPKKSIAKTPRSVSHIFHRFHQIVIYEYISEYIRPLFFDASHA